MPLRTPLLLLLAACVKHPPVPEVGPAGANWLVYNQSYNVTATTSSSTTYSSYGAGSTNSVTVVQSTYNSANLLNVGSFLDSTEDAACEGYGWVRDCPAFSAPAPIHHEPPVGGITGGVR